MGPGEMLEAERREGRKERGEEGGTKREGREGEEKGGLRLLSNSWAGLSSLQAEVAEQEGTALRR